MSQVRDLSPVREIAAPVHCVDCSAVLQHVRSRTRCLPCARKRQREKAAARRIQCKDCGEWKAPRARGLCTSCYSRRYDGLYRNFGACSSCGEASLWLYGKQQKCLACKAQLRLRPCSGCGRESQLRKGGQCTICTRTRPCLGCGTERRVYKGELCATCCRVEGISIAGKSIVREATCATCKVHKRVGSSGVCSRCYQRARRKTAACVGCDAVRTLRARGLCNKCYDAQRLAKKQAKSTQQTQEQTQDVTQLVK